MLTVRLVSVSASGSTSTDSASVNIDGSAETAADDDDGASSVRSERIDDRSELLFEFDAEYRGELVGALIICCWWIDLRKASTHILKEAASSACTSRLFGCASSSSIHGLWPCGRQPEIMTVPRRSCPLVPLVPGSTSSK